MNFRDTLLSTLTMMQEQGFFHRKVDLDNIMVDRPKDLAHGDIMTNAAMICASAANMSPKQLAELIVSRLLAANSAHISNITVAGPGFINIVLDDIYWQSTLLDILQHEKDYGINDIGHGQKINIEYVSANPTGPLHAGHGRCAAVADALANLLEKVGYHVTREYYINDTGGQAAMLAKSVYWRYQEALGVMHSTEIPAGYYPGEYLCDVAQALVVRDGDKWLKQPENIWLEEIRNFAVYFIMQEIKADLTSIGIKHDVFTSELALQRSGLLDEMFAFLEQKGLIHYDYVGNPQGFTEHDDYKGHDDYKENNQKELCLFKTTEFGDRQDHPLKKTTGEWTYFAGDIAYHWHKIRRGYDAMIDVLGADHGGHVARLKAATAALSDKKITLDVILCQMVGFADGGVPIKMSKRAGTFVTLRDVVDKVGKDVFRFIMISRKADSHFCFDLQKVLEHSASNPVFYVQYAHARSCSVLRRADELFPAISKDVTAMIKAGTLPCAMLNREEIHLVKWIADWPRQVRMAAQAREPHRIVNFLYEISSVFHILWSNGKNTADMRFIIPHNYAQSCVKYGLIKAFMSVIASGLNILGVIPLEEIR